MVAISDQDGRPVTCAVDMMDCDSDSLYFLTAKGKSLYARLKRSGYLSLTGMKGADTISRVAVSVRGKVRELGAEKAAALFEKNPYMYEIYPSAESRSAISVFQIYEGLGEWFDLSKKPIERADFHFGGARQSAEGYFVTDSCIGCGLCCAKCPQKCIDTNCRPVVIRQSNCLRCGNCLEDCPVGAVVKKG